MKLRSEAQLGHALREKRRALGKTQSEIATKAGLQQKTISNVEAAKGFTGATLSRADSGARP